MKILIGLRFQPRSQGSLLPVPSDSRRVRERTWERGCWGSSYVLLPFHFPVPRFSNIPKKSYIDTLFCQEAGEWK